jgi:hypothetical protein
MKNWQKEVLEMTKDEPLKGVFVDEKTKQSLRDNGFKVKDFKSKKVK